MIRCLSADFLRPAGQPWANDMDTIASTCAVNALEGAYVSGSWHGIAAGVLVTLGLIYVRRRWPPRRGGHAPP